jgi:hypothetical protein
MKMTADDRETIPLADPLTGRISTTCNYCYLSAECGTITSRNSNAVIVYREIYNTNITIVTEQVSVVVMFYTVNHRYNRLKGEAGCPLYIANTRNKHRDIQYYYKKSFLLGFLFILNSFLNTKTS